MLPLPLAGYHGRMLADDMTPMFLKAVEELIKSGFTSQIPLSHYPDREVYKVTVDDHDVYLKRYRITQLKQKLQTVFYAHKAQKSWRIAHILLKKGISTPRPIALLTRRNSFLSEERLLLTEGISNGLSLREYVRQLVGNFDKHQGNAPAIHAKRRLIRSVAEFLAQLHRSGVYHGDFTAGNIFIQEKGDTRFQVYLIDLDSVRSTCWIPTRRRIKNLDELGRNFLDLRVFSTTDRIRFLKYYLNAYKKGNQTLRSLFHEVSQRTKFRLRKHQQRFIR